MTCERYLFVCALLFLCGFDVEAQRQTACQTPNGEWAHCTSIYNCNRLLNLVRTRDDDQLRFLRESQCGYDSAPLVCCGSTTNFRTTTRRPTSVADANQPFRRNPALPRRDACGFQEIDKIFNGEDTKLDEYPWMALLQYRNSTNYVRWSCGGTLINRRYILTAAHCVTGLSRKAGNLVKVRLGEYDTTSQVDCIGNRNCNDPPVDIEVESVVYHEGYDTDNSNRYNDIGLVRLSRDVQYTNFIRPICLPEPNEEAPVGQYAVVAGWGATQNANSSPKKQKLQVPIADKMQCARTFSSAGIRLRGSQICAGGQDGKDSCRGDSGGPLMMTTRNDSSQWYLEGVVSFGTTCGTAGWPGIYTKVENYLQWIHNAVRG